MVCFPSPLRSRPIRAPAGGHRPPCCIWQGFKTTAGMSVCARCWWQQANRGCHERAWPPPTREKKQLRGEKRREGRSKCELHTEGVWGKMREGVGEIHKRRFVWQMAVLGLLGVSGLGIPQIIQSGRARV